MPLNLQQFLNDLLAQLDFWNFYNKRGDQKFKFYLNFLEPTENSPEKLSPNFKTKKCKKIEFYELSNRDALGSLYIKQQNF